MQTSVRFSTGSHSVANQVDRRAGSVSGLRFVGRLSRPMAAPSASKIGPAEEVRLSWCCQVRSPEVPSENSAQALVRLDGIDAAATCDRLCIVRVQSRTNRDYDGTRCRRARDALLTQLIAKEEALDDNSPAEDLLSLDGMEKSLAFILASRGVVTREDLAEQAIDDLLDIEELDEERAGELIMAARAHWFEADEQASAE